MEIPGHWRGGPGDPPELTLGEIMTILNRASKYFRLKSKWGLAHFRLNRGQTLVLQKSWRVSAYQVSFISAELLFPSETSSVWIFSKYMRQSIDQNANEQNFFSDRKTNCIFRTHWWRDFWPLFDRKNALTFVTKFNLKLSFYSKNIVSGWGTFISQLPQNHRMMEW